MDLLKIIQEQVESISNGKELPGLNSVITHIERAEYLLNEGVQNRDEDYFTDVIYRTNQAFEGGLKEAYSFLAGNTISSKVTPYVIENYLMTNNVFKERVLDQLKNYRQNWRNPSTHDHKLFFDRSESILAIVSVTTFLHLLLNQIMEHESYKKHTEKLMEVKSSINLKSNKYNNDSKLNRITEIILELTQNLGNQFKDVNELELFGAIEAYIDFSDSGFTIIREPLLSEGGMGQLRPDFVISNKTEKFILEVKRFKNNSSVDSGINQILQYLEASKIYKGILLLYDLENPISPYVEHNRIKVNNQEFEIIIIRNSEKQLKLTLDKK